MDLTQANSLSFSASGLQATVESVLGVVEEGSDAAHSLFSRGFEVSKECEIYPFDIFIGMNFVFATLLHVKTFVNTFREYIPHVSTVLSPIQKEWDKMRVRAVSSLNTIGSLARLLDWSHDRGYFLCNVVQSVALKLIGSFTGVVNFGYRAIESLEKIKELDRLAEFGTRLSLCREGEFNAHWYATYSSFIANFNFTLYSGLQVSALLTGIPIAVEVSSMILTIASVMLIVSLVFQMADASGPLRDRLRLYDKEGQRMACSDYSFVRNLS